MTDCFISTEGDRSKLHLKIKSTSLGSPALLLKILIGKVSRTLTGISPFVCLWKNWNQDKKLEMQAVYSACLYYVIRLPYVINSSHKLGVVRSCQGFSSVVSQATAPLKNATKLYYKKNFFFTYIYFFIENSYYRWPLLGVVVKILDFNLQESKFKYRQPLHFIGNKRKGKKKRSKSLPEPQDMHYRVLIRVEDVWVLHCQLLVLILHHSIYKSMTLRNIHMTPYTSKLNEPLLFQWSIFQNKMLIKDKTNLHPWDLNLQA